VEPVRRWYVQDPLYQVWGPFTNDELERELARGDALVAAQGMKAWVPALELFRGRRIGDVAQALLLDDDGQPLNRAHNQRRRADRAVNEMLGLVRGVIADGRVSNEEIEAVRQWLVQNAEVAHVWPINVLAERIARIFSDGVVDELERSELLQLFQQTTGGGPSVPTEAPRVPDPEVRPSRLPLCTPAPELTFAGKVYVMTGAFVYGTRHACEEAVVCRGAQVRSSVTKQTHVLVIGAIGSTDWIHSSYGRKIEKAVEYRSSGVPLNIVSEEHWQRFVAVG
jgi:NAD-dependent DNA ligase